MSSLLFILPKSLNTEGSIRFVSKFFIEIQSNTETVTFDWSNVAFVEPFAMIYLGHAFQKLVSMVPKVVHKCTKKNNAINYLENIGFFKIYNIPLGSAANALGGIGYIPVTFKTITELEKDAIQYFEMGEYLEKLGMKISKVITQIDNEFDSCNEIISYSIREILRNVYEHSESKFILYCAQYWETKGVVELVIADGGKGILAGLNENPFIKEKNLNEKQAIEQALMPGISGKMFKGVKKDHNNAWQNSGYGLYMTNRLCRNGGDFVILSNNVGLKINGTRGKEVFNCHYNGVLVKLRIKCKNIKSDLLGQFKDEALRISNSLGIDFTEPSTASTMLRTDFLNKEC